ncbi:MAG: hypothetical protein FJ308_04370 [Planctomycetes bacterium]|nr:hypothetical protein [Planctomycetota bacterium]
MSFPVSWLSAAALPPVPMLAVPMLAVPMLGETAKNLTSSTGQAFGNLLQNLTSPANGLSEPNSTRNPPKPDGLRERDRNDPDRQIKNRLSELISRVKKSLGLGSTEQSVTVVADGWGIPKVEGNPLLNTHVQSQLEQDPDLIASINQRARQLADPQTSLARTWSAQSWQSDSGLADDPLRWLPMRNSAMSQPNYGTGNIEPGIATSARSTESEFSAPHRLPNQSPIRASWSILG